MTKIVQINVTQTVGPAPQTLQSSGALVSQGATTLAAQKFQLLTQMSDLTAILKGALAISTMTWASSVVTVTTAAPHGFAVGDTILLTIAGAVPTGYNGTYTCTITGASTFTFPLAGSPGTCTTPGTYTPEDVSELVAMATTFFAQGTNIGVYVLELGAGNANDGVTALTTYLNNNPNSNYTPGTPGYFYAYLVPRTWDANSSFLALIQSYEGLSAKTYFFVTTTTANYTTYTALMKCVMAMVEAGAANGQPVTEFSIAAWFYDWLNYAPSAVNKVTPAAYDYLYGVTPYPTVGNATLLAAIATANVNVVGTGAEGGISNTILLYGTTMDGHDATYWYSVDWVALNSDEMLSNAVINGSNNPQNPLYFDQNGINSLQAVAQQVVKNGIAFGLVLPPATVNAIPFATYVLQNPTDYPAGIYRGLSLSYTPQRGFKQIIYNINVAAFPSQG